jgi:hypothetical protein
MVSDWSGDFHSCNRRPNLLPTLSSSGVVKSHVPYHPRRRMGSPLTPIVHRKLCPRRWRERTILWHYYLWLLVLDLAPVQNRTIHDRLPLYDRLGYILLHSLLAHFFPTTRQHQRLRKPNHLPPKARYQYWQDE